MTNCQKRKHHWEYFKKSAPQFRVVLHARRLRHSVVDRLRRTHGFGANAGPPFVNHKLPALQLPALQLPSL